MKSTSSDASDGLRGRSELISFLEIADDHPALSLSPLVRSIDRTFSWITEHGGIHLTPSKAFRRTFVQWAAAEFNWPDHTEADLFAVNKVLNEQDFLPLMVLHDLLLLMKLGRHYKGEFRLTKAAEELVGHPGRVFGSVVPFFLFRTNHANLTRLGDEPIVGNWDTFLNVLNVETEVGATGAHLRQVLYGAPDKTPFRQYDTLMGDLYIQVLRPLCWTGLLQAVHVAGNHDAERTMFMKSPLWRATLQIESDRFVEAATRH